MKQCAKCKLHKSFNEFNKNKSKKDGLQRICKICSRSEDRKSYLKSRETNPQLRLNKNKEVLKRRKEWINDFKKEGCLKCGEKRYHVLDFHHLNPSKKDFPISGASYSYKKLKQEIEKCAVLCSNCHRDFHYLEHSNNTTIEEYLN